MKVRFLLGPAGSGKTHRCLAGIREALLADPAGRPLLLLAPKQATFQLERQLLSDGTLPGYTRLSVLSFERLAAFVFDGLGLAMPGLLAEEGRVMVLRALVQRHRDELRWFRASARFPGFAQQLSVLLRELEHHGAGPDRLAAAAGRVGAESRLGLKLGDLARLQRLYGEWLASHGLEDGDGLLEMAARALRNVAEAPGVAPMFGGVWLDGFAQMTPRERGLLLALLPLAGEATLAFCLEEEPEGEPPWYGHWSLVGQTYLRCREAAAGLGGAGVSVEWLPRVADRSRFGGSPALGHLERHWGSVRPWAPGDSEGVRAVRVIGCANPEVEAVCVAREILRCVREEGRRFRDVAVLVRSLDPYHDPIRRVFARYGIPVFLDRREAVAHHPLAELTRGALRTVWFGWRHDDWFTALKSGLVRAEEFAVDWLENLALAGGWQGEDWRNGPGRLPDGADPERLAVLRRQLVPPFLRLQSRLTDALPEGAMGPTGAELAAGIERLWEDLEVARTLDRWAREDEPGARVHATVWEQMREWLENLLLAFRADRLTPAEWVSVVESGLAGLTVGVVPPVLDQVLVGAVDRSRNPDLAVVFLMGMNEGVFPAPAPDAGLLSELDRADLEREGCALGPPPRAQVGLERFYGYIACTRAREQVVVTYALRDAEGRTLNPSLFIGHLSRLFPGLAAESFTESGDWRQCVHPTELVAPLLRLEGRRLVEGLDGSGWGEWMELPAIRPMLERLDHLRVAGAVDQLTPDLAAELYGETLVTSVSRLEQFAMCPFRFFVHSGLRAEERARFELDTRRQGSFQHAVLARFHEEIRRSGRRWRDLGVEEALFLLERVADEEMKGFEAGLLMADDRNRFVARSHVVSLRRFIAAMMGWMAQYRFDPARVELGFGVRDAELPAWTLDVDGRHRLALRGRIDRVDLAAASGDGSAACVVVDYKSSARRLDRLLASHGIQMQLPAYLNVVRRSPELAALLGVAAVKPAGVFYVNLRGAATSSANRSEALEALGSPGKSPYRHEGVFDAAELRRLDARPEATVGDQFDYRLTQSGSLRKGSRSALSSGEFAALLDEQEALLRQLGRRVFGGEVRVDPYRKGRETPCGGCDYASICRIDPWTHAYRDLAGPGEAAGEGGE